MESELKFSLKRKERPVVLELDGVETPYSLKELDGVGREAYFEYMDEQSVRDEQGKTSGFKSGTNLRIKLVSLCLYSADGSPVSVAVVGSFPGTVLKELDKVASELNGFGSESVKAIEKK
jgi:hypothetical protein